MSRFVNLKVTSLLAGNVDKLLGILLTASKELKRSLAPTGKFVSISDRFKNFRCYFFAAQ